MSPVARRWAPIFLSEGTSRKVQLRTEKDGLTPVNLFIFFCIQPGGAGMPKWRIQAKENRTVKEGSKVSK